MGGVLNVSVYQKGFHLVARCWMPEAVLFICRVIVINIWPFAKIPIGVLATWWSHLNGLFCFICFDSRWWPVVFYGSVFLVRGGCVVLWLWLWCDCGCLWLLGVSSFCSCSCVLLVSIGTQFLASCLGPVPLWAWWGPRGWMKTTQLYRDCNKPRIPLFFPIPDAQWGWPWLPTWKPPKLPSFVGK